MKTKQMQVRPEAGHQSLRNKSREDTPPEPDPTAVAPEVAERKKALDDDIDSLLEEIDGVLEANAEEFVNAFVQKGGQ